MYMVSLELNNACSQRLKYVNG